jgi:hypothetical protein
MAVPKALREQVEAAIMARGNASVRQMFGTTVYLAGGRMLAFWVADGIVTRTTDESRRELLEAQRAAPFQGPQGGGFGDWIRLPLANEDDLKIALQVIEEAAKHIGAAGLARRKGKRK